MTKEYMLRRFKKFGVEPVTCLSHYSGRNIFFRSTDGRLSNYPSFRSLSQAFNYFKSHYYCF